MPSPSINPTPSTSENGVRTRNLTEVAVLLVTGHRLNEAVRVRGKVVFSFRDSHAASTLNRHRNGELEVNSRDFVNAINAARDIAFGT